ncbi:hypothetical protein RRG08_055714 [Elysia crispata]|uniref:Uncharacterized protein n=1 Tax=Elysia crispata TaxID=231223 RepID=A0AAE1AZ94_9GAST|nr:hypothetical protein RRG08_055714 [Elysia crispata]
MKQMKSSIEEEKIELQELWRDRGISLREPGSLVSDPDRGIPLREPGSLVSDPDRGISLREPGSLVSDPDRGIPLSESGSLVWPAAPGEKFNNKPPSLNEINAVMHKARAKSASGPHGVLYLQCKRCPNVLKRLHKISYENGYINTSVQKGGIPGISGCLEHATMNWEAIQRA